MQVGLVKLTTDAAVTDAALEEIAAAIDEQSAYDVAPFRQTGYVPCRYYPGATAQVDVASGLVTTSGLPAGVSPHLVLDYPTDQGELGDHYVTDAGLAILRSFWGPVRDSGGDLFGPSGLSPVMSHEHNEASDDPYANKWVQLPDDVAQALGAKSFAMKADEACLGPESVVTLVDGTRAPIAVLAERGGSFLLSSCVDGRGRVARAGRARVTRRRAATLVVRMTDGATVRCTPDHRLMLLDGRFVRADALRPGDLLRGDVPPGTTCTDPVYRTDVDVEPLSEDLRGLTRPQDLPDPRLRQLRVTSALPARDVLSRPHPTPLDGLRDVVTMRADVQMIRSHAGPDVARVADEETFGNGTVSDLVRETMREMKHAAEANLSVADVAPRSRPEPAPVRFPYLQPEAFLQGRSSTIEARDSDGDVPVDVHPPPVHRAKASRAVRTWTAAHRAHPHARCVDRIERGVESDVYDLTVPGSHNFALADVNVFVHNCDECEAFSYQRPGVRPFLSDVLSPRSTRPGPGPYDLMRKLSAWDELAPECYRILMIDGVVKAVFGDRYSPQKLALKMLKTSKPSRRGVLWTPEHVSLAMSVPWFAAYATRNATPAAGG